MTKRNMRIEINKSQPLDEVVMELGRLGYHGRINAGKFIVCSYFGKFAVVKSCNSNIYQITTLDELKQMQVA